MLREYYPDTGIHCGELFPQDKLMKYFLILLSLAFVLSHSSDAFAQRIRFSEEERTIIRLQDDRHGIDTIARYLDSKNEKVAWRAAIALANIRDTSARSDLVNQLAKERRPSVFAAIAFALGVMGPDLRSFEALLQRIHPAASRVKKLAAETPAMMIVFDLLAADETAL
ncbi:MAG: HEAT repeat domain-containing protein, partial [Bacteroidota bacterium]|nr:HEAT repeat domain-containing protein [Bacteroidota bacterium]